MNVVTPPAALTPKDFTSDQEVRWCPGCGDYAILKSVRATPQTEVSILGQNDRVLEYQPAVVPKTTFRQETDGLRIREVVEGPDGAIWVLEDGRGSGQGRLLRLTPG